MEASLRLESRQLSQYNFIAARNIVVYIALIKFRNRYSSLFFAQDIGTFHYIYDYSWYSLRHTSHQY